MKNYVDSIKWFNESYNNKTFINDDDMQHNQVYESSISIDLIVWI